MKNKEILKEKEIINEYGVKTRFELAKWFRITKSGIEYDVEYAVEERIIKDNRDCGGYFRTYKRLSNALKDTIVESYEVR